MTNKKLEITCIICPIGCKILVEINGKNFSLCKGNKCIKGIEYAKNEALNPRRMITSLVLVNDGEWPLVSVKSSDPVPKKKIHTVLKEIKNVNLYAPVKSGQIIIKNVANTDINIIATKSIKKITF